MRKGDGSQTLTYKLADEPIDLVGGGPDFAELPNGAGHSERTN